MSKNSIIIFRVRCTKQPRAAVLGVIIILCLFVVYPQTEKKKKNYTVLEYCIIFFLHFIYKRYSSLVYLSIVLHGTRVYQA